MPALHMICCIVSSNCKLSSIRSLCIPFSFSTDSYQSCRLRSHWYAPHEASIRILILVHWYHVRLSCIRSRGTAPAHVYSRRNYGLSSIPLEVLSNVQRQMDGWFGAKTVRIRFPEAALLGLRHRGAYMQISLVRIGKLE